MKYKLYLSKARVARAYFSGYPFIVVFFDKFLTKITTTTTYHYNPIGGDTTENSVLKITHNRKLGLGIPTKSEGFSRDSLYSFQPPYQSDTFYAASDDTERLIHMYGNGEAETTFEHLARNESEISDHYLPVVGSDVSLIANTMNALLGVSIFAMPWGFAQSGVIGGCLLVVLIGILSFETARVLLVAQKHIFYTTGEVRNYPEIATYVIGPSMSALVRIATIISCLGGCTGYLIFLGETVGQVFSIPMEMAILYLLLPIILLSWIRSFQELTIFTIFGVVSLIFAIIAIIVDGVYRMDEGIEKTPLFSSLSSTMNFVGPTTFLFTIHYCVLSMGSESLQAKEKENHHHQQHQNQHHQHFQSEVEMGRRNVDIADDNSFQHMYHDSYVTKKIIPDHSISSTSHDYEEYIRSKSRSSLHLESDGSISDVDKDHSSKNHSPHSFSYDSAYLSCWQSIFRDRAIFSMSIAYVLSIILISLLGSGGFAVYREAAIVINSAGNPEPGCMDHVCQNVVLNLSPGWSRIGVGLALCISIILSYILILIPAREHIEFYVLSIVAPSTSSGETACINTLRTVLVVSTAILAVATPYFGSMLGSVGGLTDALQSFVLPPLIYFALKKNTMSVVEKLIYGSIVLWGVGTILFTLWNSLQDLLGL